MTFQDKIENYIATTSERCTHKGFCSICTTYSGLYDLCAYCRYFVRNPERINTYRLKSSYSEEASLCLLLCILGVIPGWIAAGYYCGQISKWKRVNEKSPPGEMTIKIIYWFLLFLVFAFLMLILFFAINYF